MEVFIPHKANMPLKNEVNPAIKPDSWSETFCYLIFEFGPLVAGFSDLGSFASSFFNSFSSKISANSCLYIYFSFFSSYSSFYFDMN